MYIYIDRERLTDRDRDKLYMYIYIYIYTHTYMVFTTEYHVYIEVGIESWPEWDLNPRPLNSVETIYIEGDIDIALIKALSFVQAAST